MPPGSDERGDRFARIALVAAMAVSAAAILILGRGLWFWADELDWLIASNDFSPRSLLMPHASHLIAIPRVIYELFPRVFGAEYLPFRILGIVVVLSCAAMLFTLLRRRVGPWPALAGAIVLLFLGTAEEIVLSPLGLPFTISIAFGLAAMLAVERRDLRGDVGATVLLCLSILGHTFGVIVAVGVGVYYATDRGRRRELWVAAVPILLWVAWWIWARQFDQGITDAGNIPGIPLFVIDAAGAAIEAVTGLKPILEGHLTALFGLAGLAALGWRILRGGITPWLWAYLAMAIAFWAGLGLAESAEREPTTPRYLFFGAVVVMLIAAEAARDVRLGRRGLTVLAVVFAVALAGNGIRLVKVADFETGQADEIRAQIGVQDLEGDRIAPDFYSGRLGPPADPLQPAPAGSLRAFASEVGPLGDTVDELRSQSEAVRSGADFVLVRGLGVEAGEVPAGKRLQTSGCVLRRPAGDGYTTFELEPGSSVLELVRDPGEPGAELDLGRFGDVPDTSIGELHQGRQSVVLLPDDGIDQPWLARTTGTVRVCGIASR